MDILNSLNLNKKQEQPIENQVYKPSVTLLEWEAPERAFKKYSREFYRRMGVILLFFGLLLLMIQDFTVIAVLGIIFFVIYVFHTIPPRNVIHKITSNGVYYAMDYHYMWKELKSFYFEEKDGIRYLVINTVDPLPGRIFLIIAKDISNDHVMNILNQYLSFDETPESNIYEDMIRIFKSKVKLKSFSEE
jgi:cell division protein FtsW (lipid II flippase)